MGELENARLVRLLCKFGFINERPEYVPALIFILVYKYFCYNYNFTLLSYPLISLHPHTTTCPFNFVALQRF